MIILLLFLKERLSRIAMTQTDIVRPSRSPFSERILVLRVGGGPSRPYVVMALVKQRGDNIKFDRT